MKKTTIIIIAFITLNSFAQNKKELEEKIIIVLEENSNLKLNLTNTINSLSQTLIRNNELEKLSKEQMITIEKLTFIKDSLITNNKNNSKIILNPINEKDSIIKLVQSYFRSAKWEDRLTFVLKPEYVKEYMKSAYSENFKSSEILKENISLSTSNIKLNKIFKVFIDNQSMYLKKTNEGFKIDWLASRGFNLKALNVFKANKETVPAEFRAIAKISNFYPIEYQKDYYKDFISVEVNDIDYNTINCLILRTDEDGKRIYKLLEDGKEHQIILSIKYDIDQKYSEFFATIKKLISETWSKE